MSEKQIKTIHKSPQVKENLKNKKKKSTFTNSWASFIYILSLYCTFYSNSLNHFRIINKRNSTQFMKSFNPNGSVGNKTCYSRHCNSIWASCCNYCFITFSMCIIRHNSLHKLQHSTRKASVSNIFRGGTHIQNLEYLHQATICQSSVFQVCALVSSVLQQPFFL